MGWSEIYLRLASDLNDPQAWTAAERIIRGWAYAALRHYGGNTVEDAVADTCATLAINFDRAHGPLTFGGFTLGIFYNARRRALRTAHAALVSLDCVELATESDELDDVDELDALRAALRALPERESRALRLRYFTDASGAEIATELGVSEVNARRILCNALARLRRMLQSERALSPPGGRQTVR